MVGMQEGQGGEDEGLKVLEMPGGTGHPGEGGAAPSLLLRRGRR